MVSLIEGAGKCFLYYPPTVCVRSRAVVTIVKQARDLVVVEPLRRMDL